MMLGNTDFVDELGKDRDDMYRSGSAPPTIEGSLSAVGGLFGNFPSGIQKGFVTDDELRSDPEYVSYYYSNVNLNPRLPPPLLSREEVRFVNRFQGGRTGAGLGGIGDRRKLNNRDEINGKVDEWGGDGLIGLPGIGLGTRQKSLAEIIQDEAKSVSRHPSRVSSRNAFDDNVETLEDQFSQLHHNLTSVSVLRSPTNIQSKSSPQNTISLASHSYASALGASLSRSNTPDPLIAQAPSPRVPPIEKRTLTASSFNDESSDLVAALSGMTLSPSGTVHDENLFSMQSGHNNIKHNPVKGGASSSYYQNVDSTNSSFSNYGLSGYNLPSPSNFPPLYEHVAAASALGGNFASRPNLMAAASELQNHSAAGNQISPLYLQYLRSTEYAAAQVGALNESYMDLVQKAYLGSLISPQNSQYGVPYLSKSASLNHGYYGNPGLGLGMSYPGSPLSGPVGPRSPARYGERNLRFSSDMKSYGPWHSEVSGSFYEAIGSSLLDEFKGNKTKCFELSEIDGHVVEFSADQYGSRFIQQKLETATIEEKNMVFNEIMPHALSLMTDVFGNYVIQKFFEHGTASQIRELADQLSGHVLNLSLQMYGCRVIQKAIEVVDLDQQTKMVAELDGHIMRCVRDQNGNHVIQKCIECIPEDVIQFIVSTFYDQVVTLSTHPYGCRVIQRVLEHCRDLKTQKVVMDEILNFVCMLAQDQYGNYVVQHVLEFGKPPERTCIIKKLTGQIVQMSQQKFASNVIEKCLAFGDPAERQALVNEMLGSTDENEPLQAMMKDQFANYVVQKVLETCDDQQLELILNRIKVHLNALKKYTYGKHIVARIEKLVAAGERRIGALGLNRTA